MIHLLYEHEEHGPDKAMGATKASDVPAMLEAWLSRHATPANGWDDAMRETARAALAEQLRLGRPGQLIKTWGGLTYDVVAVFQDPAAQDANATTGHGPSVGTKSDLLVKMLEDRERAALERLKGLQILIRQGALDNMGLEGRTGTHEEAKAALKAALEIIARG